MIKSGLWSSKTLPDRRSFAPVPFLLMGLLVLVAGGIGIMIPTIVGKASPGLSKLEGIGLFGITFWSLIIGALLAVLIVLLNQRELAAAVVIAVSLLLDWYLGTYVLAPIFALVLLLVYYVQRSAERPWIAPRALWLWAIFLVLTIIPSIRGATTVYDTVTYYPNLILGAFVVFWLGTVIARNMGSVRLFFNLLAGFGTLIAIHVIIEAVTGNLLFVTTNAESFLSSLSFYQLGNTGVSRPGSFFLQPDAGGAFLAVLLFIPLGLYVSSSSFLKKLLYLTEVILIAIALLFTYSAGAWLSAGAGFALFFALTRSIRYRIQFSLLIIVATVILFVGFSSQIDLLLQHASGANEVSVRSSLWQTALRIIAAYPLAGVGLGRQVYLDSSIPYQVAQQLVPYNNPHNSYLELAAMGGIPLLCIFLILLLFPLWQAFRNWKELEGNERSLLCAGIAAIITLNINSLSFGLWTLAPMAVPGWVLLGVISSPLLLRKCNGEIITRESRV